MWARILHQLIVRPHIPSQYQETQAKPYIIMFLQCRFYFYSIIIVFQAISLDNNQTCCLAVKLLFHLLYLLLLSKTVVYEMIFLEGHVHFTFQTPKNHSRKSNFLSRADGWNIYTRILNKLKCHTLLTVRL